MAKTSIVHSDPAMCDQPITPTKPLAVSATMTVVDTIPNSGNTATVTTAGTRVQLNAASIPSQLVHVVADKDNTGKIYLGYSTVSNDMFDFVLDAGDGEYILTDDLNKIWIDSEVNGESVYYTYYTEV